MKLTRLTLTAAVLFAPAIAAAQGNPVADAFRSNAASEAKNLIAAAEAFPANKFTYKPTPAQMSFADIMVHLAQGNDYLCGNIAGTKAPTRAAVKATAPKAQLVARLKETFEFCDASLKSLDDSKLTEELEFFGGPKHTRAWVMTLTTADWADHYSQVAIYMRLNGLLPPTAKKPAS
jgi:uncharacterized damage-inducible protein DinB